MAILRNPTRDRFTILSNEPIEDSRLSLEAVGLLAYLFSKPDGWQIRTAELKRRFGIGRDKLRRIYRECRDAGYMTSYRPRDEAGKVLGEEVALRESPGDGKPGSRINRQPDKPAAGKSVPLVRTEGEVNTEGVVKTEHSAPRGGALNDRRDAVAAFMREHYPKREGGQRWADAKRHIRARLKEGWTEQQIVDGIQQYAEYCKATGIEGTRMVQQAATFVGRNESFAEDWEARDEGKSARQPGASERAEAANREWAESQVGF